MKRNIRKIMDSISSVLINKHNLFMLYFLVLLSIVGIGFASWSVVRKPSSGLEGSFGTDNVINTSEYLFLNTEKGNNGIECFTYYNTGFVDGNYTDDTYQSEGYITETEHIKIHFILDLKKCDSIYETYDSLTLDYFFSYSSSVDSNAYNIFEDFVNDEGSINCNVITDEEFTTTSKSIDASGFKLTFEFTDLLDKYDLGSVGDTVEFALDYTLNISKESFKNNKIYETFKDENFSFSLLVDLTAH